MKKLLTLLAGAALCASSAGAQAVYGYDLSTGTGATYTPITDGVVVYDGSDLTKDTDMSKIYGVDGQVSGTGTPKGYSIGFDFPYCETTMKNFVVGVNGFVYLGASENVSVTFNGMNQHVIGNSKGANLVGAVAFGGVQANADTKVSYKVVGSGSSAELVVQYENIIEMQSMFAQSGPVDMQLRLKANGDIRFVFKNFTSLTKDLRLRCGIRNADYFMSICGTYPEIATEQTPNPIRDVYIPTTAEAGFYLDFKAPGGCVAPTAQPTDLQLTATSVSVAGSYTASASADNYLVVRRLANQTTGTPADGTTYEVGQKLGDATVVYFGPLTSFTDNNVEGATTYVYEVYGANANGEGGPAYLTTNPLSKQVSTLTAAPKDVTLVSTSATGAVFSVAVAGSEDVVLLYTKYDQKNGNMGNMGYFGTVTPGLKTGDVLPNPEGYNPCTVAETAPANAGVVGYAGPASNNIALSGLEPNTMYYVAVYTRDAQGTYTTQPTYSGLFTTISAPWDGNTEYWPINMDASLPYGWESSPKGDNTTAFEDVDRRNRATGAISGGTQAIQPCAVILTGDSEKGYEAWLSTSDMEIKAAHTFVTFTYDMDYYRSREDSGKYTQWMEGDQLQIQVSEDGGKTWTPVTTMTADNHSNSSIDADLNAYVGKTVKVKLYWKTFYTGMNIQFWLDRVTLKEADYSAVPEVTVSDVQGYTAMVTWTAPYQNYQVKYWTEGAEAEAVTETVNGAKSLQLEGLTPLTKYYVSVRGEADGGQWSDWSAPTTFTTLTWPEVDAPEGLAANTDSYPTTQVVTLSWSATEEMLDYEIEYREGNGTEWTALTSDKAQIEVGGLKANTEYVWRVRANCTHDRQTGWSSQSTFTTPSTSGIAAVDCAAAVRVYAGSGYISISAQGQPVAIYSVDGKLVARSTGAPAELNVPVAQGFYIVQVANTISKVQVR